MSKRKSIATPAADSDLRAGAPLDREMKFGDLTCLRYNLLWAYEGPVWPAALIGSYSNMNTSCWLIRKGSVKLRTDGRETLASPGQWVFVASPTRHQTFSKDAEILSLNFSFTWPGGGQVIDRPDNLVFESAEYPRLEKTARQIVRLVARSFPDAHAFLQQQRCSLTRYLSVQNILPNWLSNYVEALADRGIVAKRLGLQDERILLALMEMDRHPLSQPFSLASLLKQTGLSRSRFDALFVAAMGTTPRRYLEQRRLDEARKQLMHTSSSIKEIGLCLAFRHASHFSLWFQKLNGTNAQEFRQSYRLQ